MCEWVSEPEDSSPVLTWNLGYFWSLPRGVSSRLEWGHARVLSSRALGAVSRFPSRGSRDLCLSLEAFPRGFPTGLSQVPPRCESIFGLKVEAVQGKQISLEWTETSRGLWEWWYDPGVPLAFPVGKPRGKASRERHRSLDPREGKHDTATTAREESARACPPLETRTDCPGETPEVP